MDFVIDLDPTHRVLRTTITAAVLTEELLEDSYQVLSVVASSGGPYAAIFDFSAVTATTVSAAAIRSFALRAPAVPEGRTRVVAAKEPLIFGFARMVQLFRDFLAEQFHVVHSLEEAYDLVGVRTEDFTVCLYPKKLAA